MPTFAYKPRPFAGGNLDDLDAWVEGEFARIERLARNAASGTEANSARAGISFDEGICKSAVLDAAIRWIDGAMEKGKPANGRP